MLCQKANFFFWQLRAALVLYLGLMESSLTIPITRVVEEKINGILWCGQCNNTSRGFFLRQSWFV
jgi:hypothetical protein